MDIYYLGHSAFKIKRKKTTVIINPFNDSVGLKVPRDLSADVVLVTENKKEFNNASSVSGSPVVISGPGEYEVKGVMILGLKKGDNTVYKFSLDNVNFLHLGDFSFR